MECVDTMNRPVSLQAEIVRQMQINEGKTPCYATAAVERCDKQGCVWRHDCFEETHPQP